MRPTAFLYNIPGTTNMLDVRNLISDPDVKNIRVNIIEQVKADEYRSLGNMDVETARMKFT